MNVDLIFKIAAIGILTAVINQILSRAGRDDIAAVTAIVGLAIVLLLAMETIGELFLAAKALFSLY